MAEVGTSALRGLAALGMAIAVAALLVTNAPAAPASPPQDAAGQAPVTMRTNPTGLSPPGPVGSFLDSPAGYQPQLACVTKASRGIVELRALALSTYSRGGSSPATPRACASGGTSEHKDGRAWDWMLAYANISDRRVAADFLSWLTGDGPTGTPGEMADRLGVMYVIYNRMIWSSYNRVWHAYTGSDPHTSHIHISLSWNGARAHTSFWTGRVWPTDYGPCQVFAGQPAVSPGRPARTSQCVDAKPLVHSSPEPLGWVGSSGSSVSKAQRLLAVDDTGVFGVSTRRAVLSYQRHHDLPRTGAVDQPTWASLDPAASALLVPARTPAEAAAWARRAGSPTVRFHDAGATVFALQAALRMSRRERTGFYGSRTRTAVLDVKASHQLAHSALVTPEVWALLPAT